MNSDDRRSRSRLGRLRPLTSFLKTEAGGAVFLLAAAVVALVWANSPLADLYDEIWGTELTVGAGRFGITEDLQHWVNDGLMAIFFFVVGLEIKREIRIGELRDPRAVALPLTAAMAGLAVPALLYLAVTAGTEEMAGWGIPVATDIAFALGVVTLFGRMLPAGLKVLLLTIAIADDVGAILIIAIAFSKGLSPVWLAVAVGGLLLIPLLRMLRLASPWWYVPIGIVVWVATLESGIHATIAGVALGLMTPAEPFEGRPVLEELEHRLHPVSSYLVLPLFALANAGVALSADTLATAATSRIVWGILAGLIVGKIVGITGAITAMVRSGKGQLPLGVDLRHARALAPVAGIGFTVSLFIADLSFTGEQLDEAKIGVLLASLLAGIVGAVALRRLARRASVDHVEADVDPISRR
ncbi:MAG: Na+/H+ antiporter NhaA [Nitriliruptorales bacterium]|nr:Na+/H+ antiporter NhaA [Nitriliruptorales bacterium]